jgi:hypothetical protein
MLHGGRKDRLKAGLFAVEGPMNGPLSFTVVNSSLRRGAKPLRTKGTDTSALSTLREHFSRSAHAVKILEVDFIANEDPRFLHSLP